MPEDARVNEGEVSIAMAATNPCHLWPLARALGRVGGLAAYLSGYPRWRLPGSEELPVRCHSGRTLVTYGLLKHMPRALRPADHRLFRWQDDGFDRWVSCHLPTAATEIHLLPGQALASLKAASVAGLRTVLNHASGPLRHQSAVLAEEYRRLGLEQQRVTGQDERLLEQVDREYELADWHCVASRVVKGQLVKAGVPAGRIRVLPYAAEPEWFHLPQEGTEGEPAAGVPEPDRVRLVFAGQVSLRKGLRLLLGALEHGGLGRTCRLDIYGPVLPEARPDLRDAAGGAPVRCHGPVSRARLGEVFRRKTDLLVLPSLEEGFGLVVPQALACGVPCLVSDAVGAADLIEPGVNGEVFESNCAASLARALGRMIGPERRWDRRRIAGSVADWDELAGRCLGMAGAVNR